MNKFGLELLVDMTNASTERLMIMREKRDDIEQELKDIDREIEIEQLKNNSLRETVRVVENHYDN